MKNKLIFSFLLIILVSVLFSACSYNNTVSEIGDSAVSEMVELKEYDIPVKSNIEEFNLGDDLKASIDYTYIKENEIGQVYLYIGITKTSEPTDSEKHSFDLTDFEVRFYDKYNSMIGHSPIDVTPIRTMNVGEKTELNAHIYEPGYEISDVDYLQIYKWFANWDD